MGAFLEGLKKIPSFLYANAKSVIGSAGMILVSGSFSKMIRSLYLNQQISLKNALRTLDGKILSIGFGAFVFISTFGYKGIRIIFRSETIAARKVLLEKKTREELILGRHRQPQYRRMRSHSCCDPIPGEHIDNCRLCGYVACQCNGVCNASFSAAASLSSIVALIALLQSIMHYDTTCGEEQAGKNLLILSSLVGFLGVSNLYAFVATTADNLRQYFKSFILDRQIFDVSLGTHLQALLNTGLSTFFIYFSTETLITALNEDFLCDIQGAPSISSKVATWVAAINCINNALFTYPQILSQIHLNTNDHTDESIEECRDAVPASVHAGLTLAVNVTAVGWGILGGFTSIAAFPYGDKILTNMVPAVLLGGSAIASLYGSARAQEKDNYARMLKDAKDRKEARLYQQALAEIESRDQAQRMALMTAAETATASARLLPSSRLEPISEEKKSESPLMANRQNQAAAAVATVVLQPPPIVIDIQTHDQLLAVPSSTSRGTSSGDEKSSSIDYQNNPHVLFSASATDPLLPRQRTNPCDCFTSLIRKFW